MGWFELKLIGWGVPPENPDVDAIRVRLGKVWRRLSFPDQSRLLNAAEVIAEAEAVKAAWNPKADAARHRQLRNLANDASKLARKFGLMFPPPWVGKDRDLLVRLVGLAQNTLVATMPVEKQGYACGTAQILRGVTRRLVARTGYAHFQLLADLAWLASGMRQEISEHAVRRYLEVPLHPVFSRKSAPRKVKKR